MWDVKEPTHSSKRDGREIPGVVAVLLVVRQGAPHLHLNEPSLICDMWLNKITHLLNVSEKNREDIPNLRDGFQFHIVVLKQRLLQPALPELIASCQQLGLNLINSVAFALCSSDYLSGEVPVILIVVTSPVNLLKKYKSNEQSEIDAFVYMQTPF